MSDTANAAGSLNAVPLSSFVPAAIQSGDISLHLSTQEDSCATSVTAIPTASGEEPAKHSLLSPDPVLRESKWRALLQTQREIEQESLAEGARNFRKRLEKAEEKKRGSTMGAARTLLTKGIEPLERAINCWLEESKARRGPKHIAELWVRKVQAHHVYMEDEAQERPWRVLDPTNRVVGRFKTEEEAEARKLEGDAMNVGTATAAYMTIRAVLDHVGKRPYVREVALKITELLLDEIRFRRFERECPGLFTYRMNHFNTQSYVHMARSMNAAISYAEINTDDLQPTVAQRIQIGTKLIQLFIESTGLVQTELQAKIVSRRRNKGVKTERILVPAEDTRTFLQHRNDILEFLCPVLMPMVVPPLQWAPGVRGGYRYALRNKHRLVRGDTSAGLNENREMPLVYTALNAIQNTPWVINKKPLALLQLLQERKLNLAQLPVAFTDEPPHKPFDIDTNEEARKKWRREMHKWHEKKHAADLAQLEFDRVMTTAERMQQYEAIFFPHNLDFRGRIYPISHFLTPQGDDVQKGLLQFAVGKPLGEYGATYLALHGANVLGKTPQGQKVSMMTLDERVQWIMDHSAEICAAANDPLGYKWWADADEPIQFYAFCCEWDGFQRLAREGRGYEYVCALPVSIDGSCNGLQHFSAMLRDPIGARTVNVAPNERPEDVYYRIAEAVKDKLEKESDPLASIWLASGLVDRDLAKRPTMTFSYGSKQYGFQEQLIAYLKEPKRWPLVKHIFITDEEKEITSEMCGLLSRLIWESLQEVVVAAFEGMEWLQQTARTICETKKPIEWKVPISGFHVRQEYYVSQLREVETVLAGRVRIAIHERTPEILTRKQANAVSPNLIHSLDAVGLMLAVSDCYTSGVENFAAVHDSYGTLPADMGVMWKAARQSFVRLYTMYDVVGDFAQQFQAQAPAGQEIPAPPKMGTLDVSTVLASDYFFC